MRHLEPNGLQDRTCGASAAVAISGVPCWLVNQQRWSSRPRRAEASGGDKWVFTNHHHSHGDLAMADRRVGPSLNLPLASPVTTGFRQGPVQLPCRDFDDLLSIKLGEDDIALSSGLGRISKSTCLVS